MLICQNTSPLMAIQVLIEMPYEWLYNPTIKQTSVSLGYIIETLENVIKMLKEAPIITVSICYYTS